MLDLIAHNSALGWLCLVAGVVLAPLAYLHLKQSRQSADSHEVYNSLLMLVMSVALLIAGTFIVIVASSAHSGG